MFLNTSPELWRLEKENTIGEARCFDGRQLSLPKMGYYRDRMTLEGISKVGSAYTFDFYKIRKPLTFSILFLQNRRETLLFTLRLWLDKQKLSKFLLRKEPILTPSLRYYIRIFSCVNEFKLEWLCETGLMGWASCWVGRFTINTSVFYFSQLFY